MYDILSFVSGYYAVRSSKYFIVRGIMPASSSKLFIYSSLLLNLPNIVKDFPAPVIPYAKAVEFMPFKTFSIKGTTLWLKISKFVAFSLYTPSSWKVCYLDIPSLRYIVDSSIMLTAFFQAP